MRADVLLQHAGLLAADATLLADVLPSAAAAHVHVVLVGLVPVSEGREGAESGNIRSRSGHREVTVRSSYIDGFSGNNERIQENACVEKA